MSSKFSERGSIDPAALSAEAAGIDNAMACLAPVLDTNALFCFANTHLHQIAEHTYNHIVNTVTDIFEFMLSYKESLAQTSFADVDFPSEIFPEIPVVDFPSEVFPEISAGLCSFSELHEPFQLGQNNSDFNDNHDTSSLAQTSSVATPSSAQTSSVAIGVPKPLLPATPFAARSGNTVAVAGSLNSVNPINSYLHYLYYTAFILPNSHDFHSNSKFSVSPKTPCMRS